MKRFRKSIWLTAALALYLTACYVYLYAQGKLSPDGRSLVLVGVSYLLVVGVWWLNRRRERSDRKS